MPRKKKRTRRNAFSLKPIYRLCATTDYYLSSSPVPEAFEPVRVVPAPGSVVPPVVVATTEHSHVPWAPCFFRAEWLAQKVSEWRALMELALRVEAGSAGLPAAVVKADSLRAR